MMKVLVSTKKTQGQRENDFCFVPFGDLVCFGYSCDRDRHDPDGPCGCRRSMVGVKKPCGTTTFTVVRRRITRDEFARRVLGAYRRCGFAIGDADELEKFERDVRMEARSLLAIANAHRVGTVLERRGRVVRRRVSS